MADERVTTILDVKLDAAKVAGDLSDLITRIAALKQQQKDLNEAIKAGEDVDGKYAEQLIRVKDQLAWTEKQAKGLSATTKLLTADTLTYSDSLNGERQKLADMQKAYDQLDKAQRESEGGQAFLEAIKAQSDAVKNLEAETGRAQRNVGNYPKAWGDSIPMFGRVQKAMQSFGVGMQDLQAKGLKAFKGLGASIKSFGKAFLTPPVGLIVAVLSAIMAVVQKVSAAFKKNDDAMTAVQKAFAIFKPIGEAVAKVFDAIASGLAAVATAAANAAMWVAEKLAPSYAKTASEAQKLVERQDQLEESERNHAVNSAKRAAAIGALREKATQSEKYSLEERRAALEKALQYEQDDLNERKIIASERLKILEAEAKQNADTSDEMKNKIAEARAAMYQADADYYGATRKMNSQLTSFDKEERQKRQAAADKAKAKREAERKAEEEAEKARAKNAAEIAQQAEDFALSLIEDETARTIAARKIQGQRDIAALQDRLDNEKNLTEESRNQLAQLIKDKQKALDKEVEQMTKDAADKRSAEEYQAEQEKAQRILELKLGLAEEGSAEELELQKQLLTAQMQAELENTQLTEEEKYLIRKTFEQKAEELDKQYHDNLVKQAADAKAAYRDQLMSTAAAASSAFGAMSDLLAKYGEENEEAAAASKAFGIMQIITDQAISIADTAKAIAAAVAGATSAAATTGPAAPFVLGGYIAAMVGAVLGALGSIAGTIAQAKSLMAEADAGNYATGGTVPGTSYQGDKLIAHVNSGEGIYTGTQANNLLQEIANNPLRGNTDAFASAMAEALQNMPAPVMVLQEFREFEQQVATFEEIASV